MLVDVSSDKLFKKKSQKSEHLANFSPRWKHERPKCSRRLTWTWYSTWYDAKCWSTVVAIILLPTGSFVSHWQLRIFWRTMRRVIGWWSHDSSFVRFSVLSMSVFCPCSSTFGHFKRLLSALMCLLCIRDLSLWILLFCICLSRASTLSVEHEWLTL